MDYPTTNNPGSRVFILLSRVSLISHNLHIYIRVIVPFHFSASSFSAAAPQSVSSPLTVHEYSVSDRHSPAFPVSPHSEYSPESSNTFSLVVVPVHPILSEPVELSLIPIEQNRCAMACQGCGAVLFLLKSSGITFHNPLLLSYHTKQLN